MGKKDLILRNNNMTVKDVKGITAPRKPMVRERNKKAYVSAFEERCLSMGKNEEFRVKDILDDEWDEFSDGLKRSIGTKIAKKVKKGEIPYIEVSRKKNNATYYRRAEELIIPYVLIEEQDE